jgi:hypothetical protein
MILTTTARETAANVRTLSPVIKIVRFSLLAYPNKGNSIDSLSTAVVFTDTNLRHIVNRRMKWSDVEGFVRVALVQLVFAIVGERTNIETTRGIDETVDLVRDAANRRRSWSSVENKILTSVADLIRACLRVL